MIRTIAVGIAALSRDAPGNVAVEDDRIGRMFTRVTRPEMVVYRPPEEEANGTAVVVCPGGGHEIVAWELEGVEAARWLTGLGITATVLAYRVPAGEDRPDYQAPMEDAQQALRLVRENAEAWGLDAERVEGSVAYFLALRRNDVSVEMHNPSGGHGYGLRQREHAVSRWPDLVETWLRSQSLLRPR